MSKGTTKRMTKLSPKELARLTCLDCGVNVVTSGDWYLAKPEIWKDELGLGWYDNRFRPGYVPVSDDPIIPRGLIR
jgi:hypothetical protein